MHVSVYRSGSFENAKLGQTKVQFNKAGPKMKKAATRAGVGMKQLGITAVRICPTCGLLLVPARRIGTGGITRGRRGCFEGAACGFGGHLPASTTQFTCPRLNQVLRSSQNRHCEPSEVQRQVTPALPILIKTVKLPTVSRGQIRPPLLDLLSSSHPPVASLYHLALLRTSAHAD